MATRTRTKAQPNAALDAEPVAQTVTVPLPASHPAPFNLPATLAPEAAAFLSMIERASRDPAVDIAKMEKLLELRNQERAYNARREFDDAMSATQAEMDPVRKNASNPETHSKYADYAALDNAIRSIYTKHGFSVSFNTAESHLAEHLKVLARVSHRSGHREDYQMDIPADGKGPKGTSFMSKTHAAGSAGSYGMRYLLLMIFNIATMKDDDGNAAGYRPAAGSAGGGSDFRGTRPAASAVPKNFVEAARQDGTLDETRKKGEMPAPKFTPPADAVQWANNTIVDLNETSRTEKQIKEFAAKHGPTIGWIKANVPAQYERISTAYGNALEAARTKAAKATAEPKPTVTDVADQNEHPPEHARDGHPLVFTPFVKNSDFMNFAEDFLPKTNAPGAEQFLAYYEDKIRRMEASSSADVKEAASWVRATAAEIINPPDSAKI